MFKQIKPKVLTLGRAVHTAWPKPEFILGPMQPGDVGLLPGADGLGKSWCAMAAALAVAKGRASVAGGMWDVPHGVEGKTLYLAIEDRERDHGTRLQKVAASCVEAGEIGRPDEDDDGVTILAFEGQRIALVQPSRKKTAAEPYEVTQLGEEFAVGIADYRLVVIDPLRAFHNLDESDGVGMDFLIRWLVSVAMKNQQAILCVHHASQGAILDKRDDHHAGRGATDFPAGCRGAWTLRAATEKEVPDEEERRLWRVLVNSKATHDDESAKRYIRKGPGGVMRCEQPPVVDTHAHAAASHRPAVNTYLAAKNGARVTNGYDY